MYIPSAKKSDRAFALITILGDGILPSQDLDQDVTYPNHPRTRSQTKRMAHLWQELDPSTNGLTGQHKPGFVHLIS